MPPAGWLKETSTIPHMDIISQHQTTTYHISALGHLAHVDLHPCVVVHNVRLLLALCPSPGHVCTFKRAMLPTGSRAGELSPAPGYLRAGRCISLPVGAGRHFERAGKVRLPVWMVTIMTLTGQRRHNPDGVLAEEKNFNNKNCSFFLSVCLSLTGEMREGCRGIMFQHEHGLLA